jgi:sulfopyruvate decarboxylase TPP-binding subunit
MVQAIPVAHSVSARAIVDELNALAVTHVISVPDTHQRSLLAELSRQSRIRLLTVCTEDEAIAVNTGLWVGGQRPILDIQHVGLLAAMNSVKGLAIDARIPTCMLVGYYGRDVTRPARGNPARAVDLIEPTLDAWGVAYFPLEGPDDLPVIRQAYRHSQEQHGPAVVLVGAQTD